MVIDTSDGIVSTASLVLGFAAAHAGRDSVMTAGIAGLVAGSMSVLFGLKGGDDDHSHLLRVRYLVRKRYSGA